MEQNIKSRHCRGHLIPKRGPCHWNRKLPLPIHLPTSSTTTTYPLESPSPDPLKNPTSLTPSPQLRTERLITCTQTCPVWVSTLLGATSPTSHIYETSYVHPDSKRVTMCSTNLTWSNLLSVRETVTYEPDLSSGHERTRFSQEARITALCGGWKKIKEKIEEASVERFGDNARKGREGFEMVLEMSRRGWEREREREAERIGA